MTAAAREAFEQAVALETSGDLDKALVAYLKAQELSPQDTEIAYRTASALLRAGYLEEAQSQLRRLVFAEPDNLNARASLGNCHLLMDDLENAKQSFFEVLDLAADNRNALYGLASVFLKEDKAQEAAGPAKKLLELLPETPSVLTLFAETQAKTSQSAAAIAAYRKALKINPGFTPALLGLAALLIMRKRFDEVIELTIHANQLAPADPLSLELLADALSGKGQLTDALEAAEAALKLVPRSQSVLVRLSVLSRKVGNHDEALDYALRAHDVTPKAAEPLNALGAALAALKFSNEARAVLTGLSSGQPLDVKIRKLAEELIATKSSSEDKAAVEADIQGTEQLPSEEPVSVSQIRTASSEPQEIAPSPGPDKPDEPVSQAAASQTLSSGEDEPLPNVLGLTRRDRT